MSIFRRNRLRDEQVKEILRSLPQVNAPADFEERLNQNIEARKLEVPNILGNLPRVSAPHDFDARLMQAIQERRRPAAPIPVPIAGGGMRIGWMNSVAGWVGGALMVMALAFFVDRSGVMSQNIADPAVTPAPVSQPAEAPAAAVTPAPTAAPARTADPASAPAPSPVAMTSSAKAYQPMTSTLQHEAASRPAQPQKISAPLIAPEKKGVPQVEEPQQPVQIQRVSPPAAVEVGRQTPSAPATSAVESDTENISSEKSTPTDSVIEGVVDTGGERGADEGKKP